MGDLGADPADPACTLHLPKCRYNGLTRRGRGRLGKARYRLVVDARYSALRACLRGQVLVVELHDGSPDGASVHIANSVPRRLYSTTANSVPQINRSRVVAEKVPRRRCNGPASSLQRSRVVAATVPLPRRR